MQPVFRSVRSFSPIPLCHTCGRRLDPLFGAPAAVPTSFISVLCEQPHQRRQAQAVLDKPIFRQTYVNI